MACGVLQLLPGQLLPSPQELLGKILIKNKKKHHYRTANGGSVRRKEGPDEQASSINGEHTHTHRILNYTFKVLLLTSSHDSLSFTNMHPTHCAVQPNLLLLPFPCLYSEASMYISFTEIIVIHKSHLLSSCHISIPCPFHLHA